MNKELIAELTRAYWMELEAAWLMCQKAAMLYDAGKSCGAEANAAKFLGAQAGYRAAERAVLTHGGMGYAEESAVSRYWIDARVLSIFEGAEETLALKVIARSLLENAA